jgi:hypothetical protein
MPRLGPTGNSSAPKKTAKVSKVKAKPKVVTTAKAHNPSPSDIEKMVWEWAKNEHKGTSEEDLQAEIISVLCQFVGKRNHGHDFANFLR